MLKWCPKCELVRTEKFCNRCGGGGEKMPCCNWCGEYLYGDSYCRGCGKKRTEAINTYPSPKTPGKIKKFFQQLFGNK